jgi:hypothetical protein
MAGTPRTSRRLMIATVVAVVSGWFCHGFMTLSHSGSGDFYWPIQAANDLLHHSNPYAHPYGATRIPYPLPAALFGLPFVSLRPELAAGIFLGITSGLLAFGLTRKSYAPLLTLLSYPYWAALITAQWSPLIMASALLPDLLPATIAKPNIGPPVALLHMNRRGLIATVFVLAVTLYLVPNWPLLWISQTGEYAHFYPLLVGLGPLLLIALMWRNHRDAQMLLLMAMVPQRFFYDQLPLWLIPKRRPEFVATVFLSWGAFGWKMFSGPVTAHQVGVCAVLCVYLPMLAVIVARSITERLFPACILSSGDMPEISDSLLARASAGKAGLSS